MLTVQLRRAIAVFAATLVCVTSCIETPPYPTTAELAAELGGKIERLNDLESMLIEEPQRGPECVVIGRKQIGRYRENRDELWVLPGREIGIERADALRIEQVDEERYEVYVDALRELGGSEVRYCSLNSHTRVMVASAGLGISGCFTVVERSATGELAGPIRDANPNARDEVRELSEGWRIAQDCS